MVNRGMGKWMAGALVGALTIWVAAGCGSKAPGEGGAAGGSALSGDIKADGSSTVFPIAEAVAEEFQKANPDVRVTVGTSGTGGGFKKLGAGETDMADASRPIKPSEVELCQKNSIEYIELPVAYDGLVVVVNPKNTWVESMTVEELKKLWSPEAQGSIMKWNQIRPEWPDKEIHLFGAGVDSGTYDYFTQAIVGKEHSSRGDYTSSEDDNVLVEGVARDELALGFFGLGYYEQNKDKLKAIGIDDGNDANGAGAIQASLETVRNGTYQPLSRPLFIYVNKKSLDKPQVAAFVEFFLQQAAVLVEEVGFIPLPKEVTDLSLKRLKEKVTGSIFEGGGSQVGVKLEDLLAREKAGS